MNRDYYCFWDCIQVLHFGFFRWLWGEGYSFCSKGFLPMIVDIMVIWVKYNRYNGYLSCETVTTQKTNPDLPMSVQESLAETWSMVASCRVRGCRGPFEGGSHYLHYLHIPPHFCLRSNNREGPSPTNQQKIGLKIYWAWPCPSEQDPVSSSVSLYHQEASISLLSLSIRGQTEWKPQSQITNQTDHMYHSLV